MNRHLTKRIFKRPNVKLSLVIEEIKVAVLEKSSPTQAADIRQEPEPGETEENGDHHSLVVGGKTTLCAQTFHSTIRHHAIQGKFNGQAISLLSIYPIEWSIYVHKRYTQE